MPLVFLLLLGCSPPTPALDAYYVETCRLLTEPACLDSQDRSCSYTAAFESEADCLDELVEGLGRCAEAAEAAVQAMGADYDDCLADLAAVECETDPVCETRTPAFVAGPCSTVWAEIAAACQE